MNVRYRRCGAASILKNDIPAGKEAPLHPASRHHSSFVLPLGALPAGERSRRGEVIPETVGSLPADSTARCTRLVSGGIEPEPGPMAAGVA